MESPNMSSVLQIAEVAALVGDPTRANMLTALADGRALTATELAYAAGVSPATASEHLMKLTTGRLLEVRKQGRHRYFRLASAQVADMLESMLVVAADGPPRYRPPSRIDDAMREARTCYNHMAGRIAVAVAESLAAKQHVIFDGDGGEVSESGLRFLADFGIEITDKQQRRMFCRPCLDWSERRLHIAGTVGDSLCRRYLELGWIKRMRDSRAVEVTAAGKSGFGNVFGVAVAENDPLGDRIATRRRPALTR
jgi:DNA-binding transcriptional ArsR family regulator